MHISVSSSVLDSAVQAAIKAVPEIADAGSPTTGTAKRCLRKLVAGGNSGSAVGLRAYQNLVYMLGLRKTDLAIATAKNEIYWRTAASKELRKSA